MITVDGHTVTPTMFPDKTSQVWQLRSEMFSPGHLQPEVIWKFENEAEFLHLAQLKDLLDSMGYFPTLKILYLPYGRQDKGVSNESTFALRTFAKLLNALGFKGVTLYDPHSEAARLLIKNSWDRYPISMLARVVKDTQTDLVCYPDYGALNKYTKMSRMYSLPSYKHIWGEKVRDQSTGNITHYELHGGAEVKDKVVLIHDDLVDGGATFVLLAKKLNEAGAKEINLFVSHGIFSKGKQILYNAGIKQIFVPTSEKDWEN